MPCSAGPSARIFWTVSCLRRSQGESHDHRHHLHRHPRRARVRARRQRVPPARGRRQSWRNAAADRSRRPAVHRRPRARQRGRVRPDAHGPVPARRRAQPGRRGDPCERRRGRRPARPRVRNVDRGELVGPDLGPCRRGLRPLPVRCAPRGRRRGEPVVSAAPPLAALRSPGFRRYLIGQVPSVTGSWAQVVALSWTVVDRDPAALGWVVAAQFTPSLLLGPWFGAVTDRHDRKRILMVAEAGLGIVAAAYALASATGRLTLALIGGLALGWGVLNALDTPARRALVPMLVTPDRSASASALSGVVLLTGMTAGSALGATLVAASGMTTAFAVNAATFAFDLVVLGTIRTGASPRVARAPGQLRDGLAYLRHTPRLRTPLVALAVLATLGFTVQVSVPVLVRTVFGAGAGAVGIAFTVVTAGGLAGSILAATRSSGRVLVSAAAVMAAAMVLTAAAPSLGVALSGLAGSGPAGR